MSELLTVKNMNVEFSTRDGTVHAVKDVSFSLSKGEILGIVGESGSGKSVTSYAIMKILDRAGRLSSGSVNYFGVDLPSASETEMRDIRGREISMIFQNARSALNPIRKIGLQIEDVLRQHAQAAGAEAGEKAIELLRQVRIRNPEQRYHAYPFELSGGMCQRVGIALAIACQPQLLIADEPTTGLDVTTQKTVMDLVAEITRERGLATILITHDLGLASTYCDRIMVMQGGSIVESSDTRSLFEQAVDPYTRRLIAATPRVGGSIRDLLGEEGSGRPGVPTAAATDRPAEDMVAARSGDPVLRVENLTKEYPLHDGGAVAWLSMLRRPENAQKKPTTFRAVDDISFQIAEGESVGLVGESGCGKSTTSSLIMRLLDQTSGTITLGDEKISKIPAKAFSAHPLRPILQMVFQDPTDSLNPRFTAARSISDPIRRLGSPEVKKHMRERIEEVAELVGLPAELLNRFPHQLSGGQKARVGIARAMALNPRLLVLDEPTAALDVSVQAVVLNLLVDLRSRFRMSYLFVSHDINVVRLLCDRVIVMKDGKIVETGQTKEVMESPATDYVRELVEAVPKIHF